MYRDFDNVDEQTIFEKSDDVDIIFHIGPHKTGTTWIQRQFFPKIESVVFSSDFTLSHAAFLIPEYGKFSAHKARQLFMPAIDRARAEGKILVISDEALGGLPYHQRFFRGIAAKRIRAAFPKARIILTTREQIAVIVSMYGEYLRCGYSSSLRGFIEQNTGNCNIKPLLSLEFYKWDKALEFYQGIFGIDRVCAVPLELMTSSNTALATLLTNFLGLPIKAPESFSITTKERPALSHWAHGVQRFANQFHPQDSRFLARYRRLTPNSLAYWVDRMTPASARTRGKRREFNYVYDQIGEYYCSSNSAFAQLTGLEIETLGYRL